MHDLLSDGSKSMALPAMTGIWKSGDAELMEAGWARCLYQLAIALSIERIFY
jgi:hypothetical protein